MPLTGDNYRHPSNKPGSPRHPSERPASPPSSSPNLNPNTGLGGIYTNLINAQPGAPREGAYDYSGTYNAAEDYYRTLNGPALANLQNQAAQAAGRLGAINNNIGAQKGSASAINNLQGRKIDNNIASNAVDINAIPRMQSLIDAQLGIAGQRKDVDLNQLFLDSNAANRDWWNAVAAQGSSTAPETQLKLDDLSQTTKNREANIMFDWTLTQLDAKEQKAKLDDRGKQLQLIADNYGIDKQILAEQLKSTLAGLDLQGITTAGQVMDMISSTNAREQQIGMEIANLAYMEAAKGQDSFFYQEPVPVYNSVNDFLGRNSTKPPGKK